jgi:hypothetical protein
VVSQQAKGVPTKDIGVPDLAWGQWGQGLLSDWWETSPELIWPQSVVTYGRMRHDPQIKGVLGAYLYRCCGPTGRSTRAAAAVSWCRRSPTTWACRSSGKDPVQTGARRRGVIWKRHLKQLLGYQVYGYMPFERRYRLDGEQAQGFVDDAVRWVTSECGDLPANLPPTDELMVAARTAAEWRAAADIELG